MRNAQFYVSGKRPMRHEVTILTHKPFVGVLLLHDGLLNTQIGALEIDEAIHDDLLDICLFRLRVNFKQIKGAATDAVLAVTASFLLIV